MGGPDSQKGEATASAAEACSYKFLPRFAEMHAATYMGHKFDRLENDSQLTEHGMVPCKLLLEDTQTNCE